jgi:hypothetical protein
MEGHRWDRLKIFCEQSDLKELCKITNRNPDRNLYIQHWGNDGLDDGRPSLEDEKYEKDLEDP